jgi:tetratricopeptide (TPR) repeat protein
LCLSCLLPAAVACGNGLPVEIAPRVLSVPALANAQVETLLANAELHLKRQQPELALRLYRQVPAGCAQKPHALLGEGACLFYLGQYETSVRTLRGILDHVDPTSTPPEILVTSRDLLGQSYLLLGQYELARKAYRELAERFPAERAYCAVMIARAHFREGAFHTAFQTVAPVLREGRFAPAYEFALDLYWKLNPGDQKEMTRLLELFLANTEKEYTGRG